MARERPSRTYMQRKSFKLFWQYSKPYWLRRNTALFFGTFSVLVESYAAPFILSLFINQLQAGQVSFANSLPLIGLYGLTLLISTVVTWRITLWATWSFEVHGQRDLSRDILGQLTRQSLGFHNNRFGGALISQTSKLVGAFERFWDVIIWDTIPVVTGIVAASTILWFMSPMYSIIIVSVAILFTLAVILGSRFMLERNKAEVAAYSRVTGFISDVVTNISTVKAFGSERSEQKRGFAKQHEWMGKSLHSMRGFLGVSTVYASILVAYYMCILLLTVHLASHQTLQIGSVFLLLSYALIVGRHMWNINGIMRSYNRLMGDAHDMVEILNLPIDITDTSKKLLHASHGDIVFDNVTFAHDAGKGAHIFNDFLLHIRPGERVGLVGHSGSGKTTLTKLLLRFNDVDNGEIRIDSTNIADVTQKSVREAISYVAQEPMLFHRSLADNIAYGRPTATAAEIEHAAKQAHAHEFISTLPEGYDTLVGERGVKLSGGQRQRIAIARAILKDAPILVLDEATSALDSESEKLIQASLGNLMKGRTSLVIAHRLSTIAKLDRIIVLEDGRVIEDGSHAALLKKKGTYAKLWTHQSGGFIEE